MSRVVVKCGGAVSVSAAAGVLELTESGHEVCVVHGAGPQITAEMERRRLPVEFVGGRRVTSPEALEVVRESLAAVNAELCASIGRLALGLMGDEIGLEARRVPELGLVGDPLPTRPPLVVGTMSVGRIPVVAPLAAGPLNVNADEAAAALAVGLGAQRLLFVTDVPGVLVEGDVLSSIDADDADRLLDEGTFEGGIVPKLRAAVRAAREGVRAEIGETAVVLR
jgi:acetylglutamate kinase